MSDIHEIHDGIEVRRLGLLPQPIELLKYEWATALPGINEEDEDLPQSQWQEVDLSPLVVRIHDQGPIGQCNCAATAQLTEVIRSQEGLPFVPLSAGDLYNRIAMKDRFGRPVDSGSMPESKVPYLEWQRSGADKEDRAPFRLIEAIRNKTVGIIATRLMKGFPSVIGYWHHDRDNPDRDGWMVNPGGRAGGHAVCAVGLMKRGSDWGIKYANSWTDQWGIKGFGILPVSRVAEGLSDFGSWCGRVSVSESVKMPSLK